MDHLNKYVKIFIDNLNKDIQDGSDNLLNSSFLEPEDGML